MCSLASLAERPDLVKNLFITKETNPEGIYRIRFCKEGVWTDVTVDDYFPCRPFGTPIFSRAHGNELWVLLIEKAYAKLHGNYYALRAGFVNEGMIDLTGCPTQCLDFKKEKIKKQIKSGELFKELKRCDEEGYLLSGSTPSQGVLTGKGGTTSQSGLIPGHAYSIIKVVEVDGNQLLNLRNPWGSFEWDGDWSDDSPLWTEEIKNKINPIFNSEDGLFWMCFKDFL